MSLFFSSRGFFLNRVRPFIFKNPLAVRNTQRGFLISSYHLNKETEKIINPPNPPVSHLTAVQEAKKSLPIPSHLSPYRFNVRKELFKLGLPSVETRIEEEEKKLGEKLNPIDTNRLINQFQNDDDILADEFIRSGQSLEGRVYIKTKSLSSLKWERIEQIFQVKELDHKPNYPPDFFPIPKDKFDFFYQFLLFRFNQTYLVFNERTEEAFIDPVLTMAGIAFKNVSLNYRFPFKSKVIPINGNVDFCLIRPKKLTSPSEYFIVEVKQEEGKNKKELLNTAMAQCFSAMEVMAAEEKRDKVYGLVTDFQQWHFLEITNEGASYYTFTPHRIDDYPTKESLKTLIIYLYDHMKKTFGMGTEEKKSQSSPSL